jgi:GNAT superfamily N-acetyltransferase
MTNSIFTGTTKDGKMVNVVPFSLEHKEIVEKIKSGFTSEQQYELDKAVLYFTQRYINHMPVEDIVSGNDFELLDEGGSRVAQIGVKKVGWWPEDTAYVSVEATNNLHPNLLRDALNYLVFGKRIVLIESPIDNSSSLENICTLRGYVPKGNDILAWMTFVPGYNESKEIVSRLNPISEFDSTIFSSSKDIDGTYYVAIADNGDPVGFTGRYNFGHYQGDAPSWLGWTGVPAPMQGKGVGKILTQAMMSEAVKLGAKDFLIETYGGFGKEDYTNMFKSANKTYEQVGANLIMVMPNFFEGNPESKYGMNYHLFSKKFVRINSDRAGI